MRVLRLRWPEKLELRRSPEDLRMIGDIHTSDVRGFYGYI
jgi:hypothetical protein